VRARLFRYWKYFRDGWHIYLAFPVTVLTFTVSVYYLLIEQVPLLVQFFPRYYLFLMAGLLIGTPLSVFLGWLHNKRGFLATEQTIALENNPVAVRHTIATMEASLIVMEKLGVEVPKDFLEVLDYWKRVQGTLAEALEGIKHGL